MREEDVGMLIEAELNRNHLDAFELPMTCESMNVSKRLENFLGFVSVTKQRERFQLFRYNRDRSVHLATFVRPIG
jgi:hypothetical protein